MSVTRQIPINTIQIVGELQDEGFIIVDGSKYLIEIHRSPDQMADKIKAKPIWTPLRSMARLYPSHALAKIYRDFVAPEFPQAVVQTVSSRDNQLAAAFVRARQLPDMESRRKRQDTFKTNLKPARVDWVQGAKRY